MIMMLLILHLFTSKFHRLDPWFTDLGRMQGEDEGLLSGTTFGLKLRILLLMLLIWGKIGDALVAFLWLNIHDYIQVARVVGNSGIRATEATIQVCVKSLT